MHSPSLITSCPSFTKELSRQPVRTFSSNASFGRISVSSFLFVRSFSIFQKSYLSIFSYVLHLFRSNVFKAKLLKLPKLEYHERNVPYGKIDQKYTFAQSAALVAKVLNKFDFGDFGKRNGAAGWH